jgi:cytochrome c2
MALPFRDRMLLLVGGLALTAGVAIAIADQVTDRRQERRDFAANLTGGVPERGPEIISRFGCSGCHVIPGVEGPKGRVGPPLEDIARRVYIGGVLPNTPDNMIRWLLDPPAVDPLTAMPATGLSETDARDIAAYLYLHS